LDPLYNAFIYLSSQYPEIAQNIAETSALCQHFLKRSTLSEPQLLLDSLLEGLDIAYIASGHDSRPLMGEFGSPLDVSYRLLFINN
jgi:hypothetical protein